jgi:hypothetical protein
MSIRTRYPLCPVCKERVDPTAARINERGQAFHEDCYVGTLKKHPSKITRPDLGPSPEYLRFLLMNSARESE